MLFGRSLIYKIKNNGPKMDPCGTPQTGPLSHKFFPLTWTTRNLVVKYHFTQSGTLPARLWNFFFLRIEWSIVSKTSDKSKTPGKKFVLSITFAVLLMRLINTREVKCFSRNPNWLLDKIIFSVGYLEIRYMLYVLYVAVGFEK